jgi:hypothetical protein
MATTIDAQLPLAIEPQQGSAADHACAHDQGVRRRLVVPARIGPHYVRPGQDSQGAYWPVTTALVHVMGRLSGSV